MVIYRYDYTDPSLRSIAPLPRQEPNRRAHRSTPVGQDNACPRVVARGLGQLLRSRGSGKPRPPERADDCAGPLNGLIVMRQSSESLAGRMERVPAEALRRFWTMLAHYHGQTWNAAEPARALGVSETTTRRHLDLLTDAFMIRQLRPYHANLRKRQVKSPKIYVRDSGLLHQLLGIDPLKSLLTHPKIGASWEGFVTPSIRIALEDLGLSKDLVLCPGVVSDSSSFCSSARTLSVRS